MKKLSRKMVLFLSLLVLASSMPAFAMDDDSGPDASSLEMKATQAHERAASDMMYQNEEWKALYYQNQQVIQLLKQIRDSLEVLKARGSKDSPAEKSG